MYSMQNQSGRGRQEGRQEGNNITTSVDADEVLSLFPMSHRRYIEKMLEQEGVRDAIGMDQWRLLSALSTRPGRLQSLSDSNTREMMLMMMRDGALGLYKWSYFNRVKITNTHLRYLQLLGTALFLDITLLISKLPILLGWVRQNQCICHMIVVEDTDNNSNNRNCTATVHEEYTAVTYAINQLITLCLSLKRNTNNNLAKFKVIADASPQDRVEIVREMGKMLRQAWKWQKGEAKIKSKAAKQQGENKSLQLKTNNIALTLSNNPLSSTSSISREISIDREQSNPPPGMNAYFEDKSAGEWEFSAYYE